MEEKEETNARGVSAFSIRIWTSHLFPREQPRGRLSRRRSTREKSREVLTSESTMMLAVSMLALDRLLCMENHHRWFFLWHLLTLKVVVCILFSHQDPYALVYILDPHTGLCKFQLGNNKTKTFDKNIKPNFNSEFQFLVIQNII